VGSISIVPPVVTVEQNIDIPELTADVVFDLTANITEG